MIRRKCCTFTDIRLVAKFRNGTSPFCYEIFFYYFPFPFLLILWLNRVFRYDKNRPSYRLGQEENDNLSLSLRRICFQFIWNISTLSYLGWRFDIWKNNWWLLPKSFRSVFFFLYSFFLLTRKSDRANFNCLINRLAFPMF